MNTPLRCEIATSRDGAVVEAVAGELMAIRRAAPDSHDVTLARAAITAALTALAQGAR